MGASQAQQPWSLSHWKPGQLCCGAAQGAPDHAEAQDLGCKDQALLPRWLPSLFRLTSTGTPLNLQGPPCT